MNINHENKNNHTNLFQSISVKNKITTVNLQWQIKKGIG